MKIDLAWHRSEVRIAVRGLGTSDVRYASQEWAPDQGWTTKDQLHAINYMTQLTGARACPDAYRAFYADWAPWQPKDPITLLGDLVRQVDFARLVA